jgi:hypothetical protein
MIENASRNCNRFDGSMQIHRAASVLTMDVFSLCPQESDSPLAEFALSFSYYDQQCHTHTGNHDVSPSTTQPGNAL